MFIKKKEIFFLEIIFFRYAISNKDFSNSKMTMLITTNNFNLNIMKKIN